MSSPTAPSGYAGDIDPKAAWTLLSGDPKAQLVDVRTAAEWTFVGVPDLAGIGREVHRVEWQSFPAMAINPAFADEAASRLRQAGATGDTPIVFVCRSGARSRAAASAMTKAGFTRAFNLAGGFEGDPDSNHHRGQSNGWKAAGLPWKQS